MAAIEKICEFSGDYESSLMYKNKRNHIQVLKRHRHNFKGAEHTLHIFKESKYWMTKNNVAYWSYTATEMEYYIPPFTNEKEFIKYYSKLHQAKLVDEYIVVLEVSDPRLVGRVNGRYMNWTFDISATKRRLKRMIGKKLNIVKHNISYEEWNESH